MKGNQINYLEQSPNHESKGILYVITRGIRIRFTTKHLDNTYLVFILTAYHSDTKICFRFVTKNEIRGRLALSEKWWPWPSRYTRCYCEYPSCKTVVTRLHQ